MAPVQVIPIPVNAKYAALIGLALAAGAALLYLGLNSEAASRGFGAKNLWAVWVLTGLIAAGLGYYASYRIAESPTVKNSLGRGALAGLFIGLAAGFSAHPPAEMAFVALLGLPAGAACGLFNLVLLRYFGVRRAAEPARGAAELPMPGVKWCSLLGALMAGAANLLFLAPWGREMGPRFTEVSQATTLLAAGVGLYYGRKVGLARRATDAMGHGAAAGALIGAINGSAVFPVIGTVIGSALGALIGAFAGGPLAFYLVLAARLLLPGKGTGKPG